MSTDAKPKAGLEDVVAATSAICYLDGNRGVLAYFGYDIHDLARGASFEEVCYLLWHGRRRIARSSATCSRSSPRRGRSPSPSCG
jgi:citrate synthase